MWTGRKRGNGYRRILLARFPDPIVETARRRSHGTDGRIEPAEIDVVTGLEKRAR